MMNGNSSTDLERISGGRRRDVWCSPGTFDPTIRTRIVERLWCGRGQNIRQLPCHTTSEQGVCERRLTAMCIWFPSRNRRSASP